MAGHPAPQKSRQASLCEPDREFIEDAVGKDRNAVAIYQDLVTYHSFKGAYSRLRHYGVVALPCRVRDPDRKGKVERSVGHAKRTPFKGQRFESLEEGQEYLDRWERTWADTRIHGTTKRQVGAKFAEELPHLQPLPLEPFRYYRYGKRSLHLDGHAYYSVPPRRIATEVDVQWDDRHVRILDVRTGARFETGC